MNIKKQLGKKIKELRIKNGYTQEELSEKMEISPKSLSQIELGNNFISADTLEKLCLTLNVSPKTLFNTDSDELDSHDVLAQINSRLSKNKELLNTIYKIVLALDS